MRTLPFTSTQLTEVLCCCFHKLRCVLDAEKRFTSAEYMCSTSTRLLCSTSTRLLNVYSAAPEQYARPKLKCGNYSGDLPWMLSNFTSLNLIGAGYPVDDAAVHSRRRQCGAGDPVDPSMDLSQGLPPVADLEGHHANSIHLCTDRLLGPAGIKWYIGIGG
jgi:hypothetical protein